MKRVLVALVAVVPALPLAACEDGYGYGSVAYASTPYAYSGFYDDYYGPIYDGYWGTDGGFYYRHGVNDRRFRRGDPVHFHREQPQGGNFHPMQGSFTPSRGMHMPHFNGGVAREGRR